jgi:hypothetical protein
VPRVGLLWRAEWDSPDPATPLVRTCKLRGVFTAFEDLGVQAEPIVYSDDAVDAVREQLLGLDAVLVWVNPIEDGRDRSTLDPLLLEVANAGVFVSAHPAVILKMGTKEVLVDTKALSWSTDTQLYRAFDDLRDRLPSRLRERSPLVLKQHRGMGGDGVWKVELDGASSASTLVVQHAAGAAMPERISIDVFLERCRPYFSGAGLMVDQPYQPRLGDGMIRVYLVHDRVVGFTHQYPRGLLPPDTKPGPPGKVFEPASTPAYATLRTRLESEWVPQLQELLDIDTRSLPVIWDADFLYGEETDAGEETYVLCEINVSSTFAFPEFAMPAVAKAAIERLQEAAT